MPQKDKNDSEATEIHKGIKDGTSIWIKIYFDNLTKQSKSNTSTKELAEVFNW